MLPLKEIQIIIKFKRNYEKGNGKLKQINLGSN